MTINFTVSFVFRLLIRTFAVKIIYSIRIMKIVRLLLLLCLLVGTIATYAQQKVNIYNADSIQKYLKEK